MEMLLPMKIKALTAETPSLEVLCAIMVMILHPNKLTLKVHTTAQAHFKIR